LTSKLTTTLTILLLTVACATPPKLKPDDIIEVDTASELIIHALNVGNASCNIVECPGEAVATVLIVDCGVKLGRSPQDMTNDQIIEYAKNVIGSREVKVVISHPDTDHLAMIPEITENQNVSTIWLGGKYREYESKIGTWLENAEKKQIPIKSGFKPRWFSKDVPELACGKATSQILTVNTANSTNSQSLVLRLKYKEFTAIFSGDAEGHTEYAAQKNFGESLKETTVLMGSGHGANTKGSNSIRWVQATKPKIVIYSAGTLKEYGHPRCEITDRYERYLEETTSHKFSCSKDKKFISVDTKKAQYDTETFGKVLVSTNGIDFQVNTLGNTVKNIGNALSCGNHNAGERWQEECNECTCEGGVAVCTEMACE